MPDTKTQVSRETGDTSSGETGTPVSRETAVAVPVAPAVMPYRGESYEDMQQQADTVFGAELEKGNLLLGVPFMAVRFTYRPGDYISPVTGIAGHYVSIDLVVGPEREIAKGIRRGRISEPCDVEPGEQLVINEGGTGVYRQTVEYLESRGWITIKSELPRGGAYGESRYDITPDSWEYPVGSPVEVKFGPDGQPVVTVDVRLECPRGLRVSEYDNPSARQGSDAKAVTRYIA